MKKSLRTYMILAAISLLLLGLSLIIWPETAPSVIVYVVGAAFVIAGIVTLIVHYRNLKTFSVDFSFFNGAILVLAGILFLVKASSIVSLLITLIGLSMVLGGLCQLDTGIRLRANLLPRWKPYLIASLVLIAFGIAIVVLNSIDAVSTSAAFSIVTGSLLIVDAIVWAWGIIEMKDMFINDSPNQ